MKVLFVDTHRMFAESVAVLIAARDGVDEAVVLGSLDAVRAEGTDLACDVAVVDWQFGSAAISEVRRCAPDARVIVVAATAEVAVLRGVVEARCDGFVTKDRAVQDLFAAIDASAECSGSDVEQLLEDSLAGACADADALSVREIEVVECITRGMSNSEIGEALFISVDTVRNHVQRISAKLSEHSRVGIAMCALRRGLVELPIAS